MLVQVFTFHAQFRSNVFHRHPMLVDVHSDSRQTGKPEYALFTVLCKISCSCYLLLSVRVKMAAGQLTGRLQGVAIVGDSHVYWLNWFLESAGRSWVSADFSIDSHGFDVEYVGHLFLADGELGTLRSVAFPSRSSPCRVE